MNLRAKRLECLFDHHKFDPNNIGPDPESKYYLVSFCKYCKCPLKIDTSRYWDYNQKQSNYYARCRLQQSIQNLQKAIRKLK